MRGIRLLLFITIILFPVMIFAQQEAKNPRILILLDGSSSMIKQWTGDKIRFEAAGMIVDNLIDSVYSVNPDVEFALRVYGHEHPTSENNCFDSKLEVMFSKDNYTQMMLRMDALHPYGVSPIAYSLQQAAEYDMKNLAENKYSLILITDGGESCDGDICTVAEELLRKKIDFKPYIISLVDYDPLKSQYDCLGDYLLVTGPSEIDPVVGKIVDAYRKSFIQPTGTAKLIETVRAQPPSALKVKAPTYEMPAVQNDTEPVVEQPQQVQPAPKPVEEPKPSNIKITEIRQRPKDTLATIDPAKANSTFPQRYKSQSFETKDAGTYTPPPPEIERPKETVYTPMPTNTLKETSVPKPAPKIPKIDPSTIQVTVKREETKETTLKLFLWDGKGKYYESAPEVVMRDPKTNEVMHKFNRFVDAYGEPRPQEVPPGRYNVTFTGKDGLMYPDIVIDAHRETVVKLPVPQSSLYFYYTDNPERPVKEFAARVNVFLARRAVTKQYCTETLMYEPGNYHIEINTNPQTTLNVDLELGAEVGVNIDEPGKIVVNNPKGYKVVGFQYQYGAKFVSFTPLDVKGNIARQEFLIQPGRYKVGYDKTPDIPAGKPVIKDFIIKSNVITEITLD